MSRCSAAGRGRGWPCRLRDRLPEARPGESRGRRREPAGARPRRDLRLRRSQRQVERAAERSRAGRLGEEGRQRRHARRRGLRGDRRGAARTRTRDVARVAVSRRPAGASRVRWCSRPTRRSPTRRGARPQLSDAGRRRPGAPHAAVHRQRREGAAVARRRRGARRRRVPSRRCFRRERQSCRSAIAGSRRETPAGRQPRSVDDADQLSRAGAGARRGRAGAAVSDLRVPPAVRGGAGDPARAEAAPRSRDLQGQDRLHRHSPRRGCIDVFGTPMSTGDSGSMPGIQLHASMADSILANRFIRPATDRSRIGHDRDRGARDRHAGGVPAVHDRGGGLAGDPRRVDLVHGRARSRAGLWLNLVQPLAVGGAGAVLRHRLPGTSSRGARSGRSRSCSADTSRATSTRS